MASSSSATPPLAAALTQRLSARDTWDQGFDKLLPSLAKEMAQEIAEKALSQFRSRIQDSFRPDATEERPFTQRFSLDVYGNAFKTLREFSPNAIKQEPLKTWSERFEAIKKQNARAFEQFQEMRVTSASSSTSRSQIAPVTEEDRELTDVDHPYFQNRLDLLGERLQETVAEALQARNEPSFRYQVQWLKTTSSGFSLASIGLKSPELAISWWVNGNQSAQPASSASSSVNRPHAGNPPQSLFSLRNVAIVLLVVCLAHYVFRRPL